MPNINYIIRRLAWTSLQDKYVSKTLYLTKSNEWTENKNNGYWHPCCSDPHAVMMCDVKYEKYWEVDGKRYTNFREATDAMIAEIVEKYDGILWDCYEGEH